MTGSTSLCLQIGSATTTASASFGEIKTTANAAEVARLRQSLSPANLDALRMVVTASDLSKPDIFNPLELANWVAAAPRATVSMEVVGGEADFQPVHTSFLLAGLASASEQKTAEGSRILTAVKAKPVTAAAVPLQKRPVVTIDNDDDDMMINEDDLLDDDVLAPPPAMGARTKEDDCDGRKPCDNCTCGRAEGAMPKENAPSSSCGKCHMGDAFRCASCPYLGKPAFKPGEEHLVLDLADDL